MASEDSEVWHLPEALDINKNPMVKLQAEQMRHELSKRAVSPFARLSPIEFAQVRARARIQHLTRALQEVEKRIQIERGRETSRQLHEAKTALQARLAENLSVVGNYALAAELAPDKAHRDEYAAKARASFERPAFP